MNKPGSVTDKLANERIGKLIWQYSLPAITGTVVMSLYNVVDRIFIGQGVGPLAISGLALTFPFMIFLLAFGMLIGAGAASRISITLGENNHEKAEKILGNAFTLTFIISGTVILLSYLFMRPLLEMFGGTKETLQYAEEFMQIIIPGGIFTALNYGFNNIMRASGYPRKAMYTMIICAILNAILAPIFIFGLHMGIRGAAWATNITYMIGTIWVLQHFFRKDTNIRLYRKNLRPEKKIVRSILSIGLSPFSMQMATCAVVVVVNTTLLKHGGDLAIGAYGIINSVNTLIVMILIGLNQGTQPILGFNYGAKKFDRMFKTLRIAAITGSLLMSLGFIGGVFFPHFIVSLFTTDITLQHMAANALRISVLLFPFVGSQIVVTNFFQSIGKAQLSIALSLTRQFVFLIPCLVFLPGHFGLNGAWAAMPVSDGFATLVAGITIYTFIRRFRCHNGTSSKR